MTATLNPTRTTPIASKSATTKAGGAPSASDSADKAEKKKGSLLKSKKFLIAIVAVLGLAGGGYMMFLAPKPKPAPPVAGDVVALDPTTLNLAGGHYLKIALGISLVKGKATMADFKTSEAASLVIDEFSNRSVASLSTNAARNKLVAALLLRMKKAYPGEIFDVYVTQFVTQ